MNTTPEPLAEWQRLADAATPEHIGALVDAASAVSSIAHMGRDGFEDVPHSHIAGLRRALDDLAPLVSAVLRGQMDKIPDVPALLASHQQQAARIAALEDDLEHALALIERERASEQQARNKAYAAEQRIRALEAALAGLVEAEAEEWPAWADHDYQDGGDDEAVYCSYCHAKSPITHLPINAMKAIQHADDCPIIVARAVLATPAPAPGETKETTRETLPVSKRPR